MTRVRWVQKETKVEKEKKVPLAQPENVVSQDVLVIRDRLAWMALMEFQAHRVSRGTRGPLDPRVIWVKWGLRDKLAIMDLREL